MHLRSSKLLAGIIAVIACVWIISGLLFSDAPSDKSKQAIPQTAKLMQVRVKEITSKDYVREIIITGRSQASRTVTIKSEINGQVTEITKEQGDHVVLNDMIAQLDVRDRAAKTKEARQRVNQRKIEYNAAKSLETKGFNSKIKLAQSKADLEAARAVLKLAEVELDKTKIIAPFDGVILDQYIELGDYLDQNTPIFKIVDLNPVELVGFVSEQNIHDVKKGAYAKAEFLNGDVVEGVISYVAPAASDETRTFRIEISLPNDDQQIKEGLTAKIKIPVIAKPAHKISPSVLSLMDDGKIGVKIVTDENKIQFVPVDILSDMPDFMWISGLKKTVNIVTVGQDFVIDGQLVTPIKSNGDGLL